MGVVVLALVMLMVTKTVKIGEVDGSLKSEFLPSRLTKLQPQRTHSDVGSLLVESQLDGLGLLGGGLEGDDVILDDLDEFTGVDVFVGGLEGGREGW